MIRKKEEKQKSYFAYSVELFCYDNISKCLTNQSIENGSDTAGQRQSNRPQVSAVSEPNTLYAVNHISVRESGTTEILKRKPIIHVLVCIQMYVHNP